MKRPLTILFFGLSFIICSHSSAQSFEWFSEPDTRGKLVGSWGYNRACYTKSDISFTGDNYNMLFQDVFAHDRQSKFDFKLYFHPESFTIPQYNFKIGYEWKGKWQFLFGADHMKYVMDKEQFRPLTGTIDQEGFELNGQYNNTSVKVYDYIYIEHTDGLNYMFLEANRIWNIFDWKNKKDNSIIRFDILTGASGGMLVPKTNATVLNIEPNDQFHIAGFGLAANINISATFFRFITFEAVNKFGYNNMPDIITTGEDTHDRAKQQFGFAQFNFQLGFKLPLTKA